MVDELIPEHTGGVALGLLAQIHEEVSRLRRILAGAHDLGIVEDVQESPALNAGDTNMREYRGMFKSVVIVNKGAQALRVAFNKFPTGDADAALVLQAKGWAVIPYRGTAVYLQAVGATSATVMFCREPQPFAAGVH